MHANENEIHSTGYNKNASLVFRPMIHIISLFFMMLLNCSIEEAIRAKANCLMIITH